MDQRRCLANETVDKIIAEVRTQKNVGLFLYVEHLAYDGITVDKRRLNQTYVTLRIDRLKNHNKALLSAINELKVLPEALEQLVVEYGGQYVVKTHVFTPVRVLDIDRT